MNSAKSGQTKNVIINNVVPLNNGDVALFMALYHQLKEHGFNVQIAAYHYAIAKKAYPDLPLFPELCQGIIFRKLPFLKPYMLPIAFLISKYYRNADVIIGAPGGYVNSFYSIKSSLSIFKVAKWFGKKTAIYSQSIGPLNEKDGAFFKSLMKKWIDFVLVRDQISNETMLKLNINQNKFKQTKDAAFLTSFDPKNAQDNLKVAVSVREWTSENRSIGSYKSMIVSMIRTLIDQGYYVDFLSTCQGIESYKNDAKIAKEIRAELPPEYQQKCIVNENYLTYHQLIKEIRNYDLVIGTRLHMCIISMLNGVPALNISYEIKGLECYRYLNLENYSIDYNSNVEEANQILNQFVSNKIEIEEQLKKIIPVVNREVHQDYRIFLEKIELL